MREKINGEITYALADHIFIVLQANKDNGNHFMTDSDLAIDVMQRIKGIDKDKYSRKVIQPKSIRGAMGDVRNIADAEGMTIVTDRKTTQSKTSQLSGWIIEGWRIATEQDKGYIEQELELRTQIGTRFTDTAKRIRDTATKSKILPPVTEMKKIKE